MFLLAPELFMKWMGYPSAGHFYHDMFSLANKQKSFNRVPDPKTLNTQLVRLLAGRESPQFRSWMDSLLEYLKSKVGYIHIDEPRSIPINQYHLRVSWRSMWQGLELRQCYPYTSRHALALLDQWLSLLDGTQGCDEQQRYQALLDSSWVNEVMDKLDKRDVLASVAHSKRKFEDEPSVVSLLFYLNLFDFLSVLAYIDAENCLDYDPSGSYSMFNSLLPTLPLQEWHPHKAGIFERYFQHCESKEKFYADCTDGSHDVDAKKVAIQEYFSGKRNIKWKTAKGWFARIARDACKNMPNLQANIDSDMFLTHQQWCVADILCGWIAQCGGKHKRLRPGDKGHFLSIGDMVDGEFQPYWTDEQLVEVFAYYPRLFSEAVLYIQAQQNNLEPDGLQIT